MEMPKSGGSYTRDPVTGALTRVETPADAVAIAVVAAPPPASEPVDEPTEVAVISDDTTSKKRTGK